jgi:hypothetical protein
VGGKLAELNLNLAQREIQKDTIILLALQQQIFLHNVTDYNILENSPCGSAMGQCNAAFQNIIASLSDILTSASDHAIKN